MSYIYTNTIPISAPSGAKETRPVAPSQPKPFLSEGLSVKAAGGAFSLSNDPPEVCDIEEDDATEVEDPRQTKFNL